MRNNKSLPRARAQAPKFPPKGNWFRITNLADAAQLHIYAEIGTFGITAEQMCRELSGVDAKSLDVRINSPGGDVFDGIAIHNALKNHPAQVHVHVDGLAASIASVIAMAGERVSMARGSQMMIHEGHTVAAGAEADFLKAATRLGEVSDIIAGFYAERAGGDIPTWRNRMRQETWYTAEEAVKAGLADEVAVPTRGVKASWDLSVFNFAGRAHSPAPDLTKPAALVAVVTPPPQSRTDELLGALLAPSTTDAVLTALLEGK